jgi:putative hydrolase of the HAD superfamily
MPVSRQPIRALLVDYGEVLCSAPDPAAFEGMARAAGVELELFGDAYWRLRPSYDRGELDGPAYWRLLAEDTGAEIDARRTAELVELDIGLWSRLDERMLAWANDVAATGVPVGLLSNMVLEIGLHLRDTLRAFAQFATVTYSFEVGLAKPDPEIYHRALESLGALPHETLFIDDRVPNVESAQALGLHAHRFLGRDGLMEEIERLYDFVPAPS